MTAETNDNAEPAAVAVPLVGVAPLPLVIHDGMAETAHTDAARTVATFGNGWVRGGYGADDAAVTVVAEGHPSNDPGLVVVKPFEPVPVMVDGQPRVIDPGDASPWPMRLADR